MLSAILKELKESGGAVSLEELSRRLGVERAALDGMMETLVRQGRLRLDCPAGGSCYGNGKACSCGSCSNMGKSYRLP